ncbi:DUF1134 domain-containing protein [uncultured Cohaesibacter sp.]|uniref:DUF1134 domain-containing protein n=1 Tax=uncultured Cohaesibacter sp. TaxID=1002546 RepID=UPI002AAA6F98|nr:DUF1134 domain-containing protein [uncultured Cohaesibacter sp.]
MMANLAWSNELINKGKELLLLAFTIAALTVFASAARAQTNQHYTTNEIVATGHKFFGTVTGGLASAVEKAVSKYGLPNGYILGQEGSGAFVAGARYGEGDLYTKNMGTHKVFWQGPSIGWDFGGDGNRTMMLVYHLPSVDYLYRRWVGVNGSAYLVGGFGVTVLSLDQQYYIVPIRSGVGARLGVNIGYLKFTRKATWNPF